MAGDISRRKTSRIPPEVGGIQVNFCKNPNCVIFGVPASVEKQPRGPGAKDRGLDTYRISGSTHGKKRVSTPLLKCTKCGETPPIKSNEGIHEEKVRLMAYLVEKTSDPTCPNEDCPNHTIGISRKKGHYYSFGETKAGSPRYRCQACGKTFSVGNGKPAIRQRLPHKNAEVFSMVVNAVPMRRICKIAGISQKTLYDKIRFLHRQAMAFVAYR